jgi:ribosomal protein S18 acetylase RimI-like enzyme
MLDEGIKIVDASLGDVSALGFIQSQTWLCSYVNQEQGITKSDIQAKVDQWNQGGDQRIAAELSKLNSKTWVAKDGDLVVGFVAVLRGSEVNAIEALHVLPEYQGQGIGTALLEKALTWLRDEKKITIEVVAYNVRAQELYKKFGFKVVGDALDDPIILPSGKRIPKVLMVRD